MKDSSKINQKLLEEIATLKKRIKQFEQSDDMRKEAEEALRQKTALLEAQLNSSIEGILVVDSQGKKVLQNQRTIDLWKIPKHIAENSDDQMQIDHIMHMTKDPKQFVDKIVYLYSHPDETSRDEVELTDGTILDRYSAPVLGRDGKYYGRIWTFRDVTEPKRSEEALRTNQLQLLEAMDLAHIVYWEFDPVTQTFVFNDPFYAFYGTTAEQEGGYLVSREDYAKRFIHPDDIPLYHQFRKENTLRPDTELFADTERRIIRRNGDVRHILVRVRLIKDNSGRIVKRYGVNQDITERKQMEETLRENERKLHAIMEVAPIGIAFSDMEGNIEYYNRRFFELFGYTLEDIPNITEWRRHAFPDPAYRESLAPLVPAVIEAQKQGKTAAPMEVAVTCKDGSVRYVEQRGAIADERFVALYGDLTERKQMETALQASEKEARQLAQENAIMAEIGQIISSTLEIDEVYERFAAEARKLIHFDRLAVNLHSPHEENATAAYVFGKTMSGREKGKSFPLKGSVTGVMAKTRKGLYSYQAKGEKDDQRFGNYTALIAEGLRSVLAVPLIYRNDVIASLHFRSKTPNAYGESELRIAERIGTQIAGAISSAKLFSDRKLGEEALRESENKFRDLVEKSLVGVYMLQDNLFKYVNSRLAEIFGYTIEEMVDKMGPSETTLSEDKQMVDDNIQQRLTGKVTSTQHEFRIITKQREVRDVAVYGANTIYKGKPATIGTLLDITEQKHAEELLRESENKFRDLVEKSIVGVYLVQDRLFRYVNKRFAEIHGYTVEELVDKKGTMDTILPEDISKMLDNAKARFQGKIESTQNEFRIVTKQREIRNVMAYGTNTIYKGKPATIGTFLDITEQKRADEMLMDLFKDLEKKNAELESTYDELRKSQQKIIQQEKMVSIGQLAAGVAHEINNPVGFVMSNLNSMGKYSERLSQFIKIQAEAIETLTKEAGDTAAILDSLRKKKQALKIDFVTNDLTNIIKESLEGTERVKRIVGDLKDFSYTDKNEYEAANINKGIESTINVVWNELKYKADVKKEYGKIPLTKCNIGQLNQVFMNLLVNAAHAIEKHGEITVKTELMGGDIVVSVSDTGSGIPEDKINRIFEPFFTMKEVGKGTGLGLSIAYDIVKKHNGEILVTSKIGKGSTFTIKIPVVER